MRAGQVTNANMVHELACWIPKFKNTQSKYLLNTYWFSIATTFVRTRLNVMLNIRFLTLFSVCIFVLEWNHICVKLSPLASQFYMPPTTAANIWITSEMVMGRINQNTHSKTHLSGTISKWILFDLSLPWT